MNGKLIVIDGLDGSGKETQAKRLVEELKKAGKTAKYIEFPNYSKPSCALVKQYLNGEISKNPADVNAYAASSFYSADRYISFKLDWSKDYKEYDFLVADRYVSSNAIYQMIKLPKEEWNSYLEWLYDFEFTKLALPCPDMVIYLDMLPEVSKKLISKRYNGDESKRDIHEQNFLFLQKCRESAMYSAEKSGWQIITCSTEKEPFTIDEIAQFIKNIKLWEDLNVKF